jgi:hypothetical protein
VADQRASVEAVKHLGEVGPHPGTQPRGEDEHIDRLVFGVNIFHKRNNATSRLDNVNKDY